MLIAYVLSRVLSAPRRHPIPPKKALRLLILLFHVQKQSLVYCGDDARSKHVAARLIRDVGFDPVDAGALRVARYTESFGLLMAELAYRNGSASEIAYRFGRFS